MTKFECILSFLGIGYRYQPIINYFYIISSVFDSCCPCFLRYVVGRMAACGGLGFSVHGGSCVAPLFTKGDKAREEKDTLISKSTCKDQRLLLSQRCDLLQIADVSFNLLLLSVCTLSTVFDVLPITCSVLIQAREQSRPWRNFGFH